jgi:NAD(P)-dependent dehydrogenase (short-subunit alcohol dehydrogenase family)
MASSASVQSFAKKASTELDRIDGLVANAGVMLDTWSTAEGIETSITVNVINTLFLGSNDAKVEREWTQIRDTPHYRLRRQCSRIHC